MPGKLIELTATPGSRAVTPVWDASPAGGNVVNCGYRMDEGGGFPETWTNVVAGDADDDDRPEYEITGLTNGTECSFQVRARNGAGRVSSSGSPASRRSRSTPIG